MLHKQRACHRARAVPNRRIRSVASMRRVALALTITAAAAFGAGGRAGDREDAPVRRRHRGAGNCGYARRNLGRGHPRDPDLLRAGAHGRPCVSPGDPARLETAADGPWGLSCPTRARRRAGVVRARRRRAGVLHVAKKTATPLGIVAAPSTRSQAPRARSAAGGAGTRRGPTRRPPRCARRWAR